MQTFIFFGFHSRTIEHSTEFQQIQSFCAISYDTLDPKISHSLFPSTETLRSQVLIPNVKTSIFKGSFEIYVFLIPKDEINYSNKRKLKIKTLNIKINITVFKFQLLLYFTQPNQLKPSENSYFAGKSAVFSAGKGCVNCESRPPITIKVDVTVS